MMHVFLAANRLELERRCRQKVMQRPHRAAVPAVAARAAAQG
jgi:hypothetical protein